MDSFSNLYLVFPIFSRYLVLSHNILNRDQNGSYYHTHISAIKKSINSIISISVTALRTELVNHRLWYLSGILSQMMNWPRSANPLVGQGGGDASVHGSRSWYYRSETPTCTLNCLPLVYAQAGRRTPYQRCYHDQIPAYLYPYVSRNGGQSLWPRRSSSCLKSHF
jgi:hypothetical protein